MSTSYRLFKKPIDDARFDAAAAKVMRQCLRHYEDAPIAIKDILENIAIEQEHSTAPEGRHIRALRLAEDALIELSPCAMKECRQVQSQALQMALRAVREALSPPQPDQESR